jgi:hypothetical protein
VANSVGYNVVDGAFRRTRVSFEQMFGMNTLPMLKYIVLILLIEIAVFAPIFVIAFIIMGAASLSSSAMSPVTENVVELFIRIVSTIVGGILYLFTQFVLFELLIARKGIIDSFRGSFGIMMRKPLETIVFSFALWAAETAVGLPFIIALIALVFVGVMFGFSTAALGALAMLPLIIIGILIAAVIFIVMIVIQTAVLLSAQYVYWNKVKAG